MDFARRLDRACRVIGLSDRKVEDCHNRIADRLVEQPVIFPDSGGAFVLENIEEGGNLRLRQGLRQRHITAQIREQHAASCLLKCAKASKKMNEKCADFSAHFPSKFLPNSAQPIQNCCFGNTAHLGKDASWRAIS
jgi:hypothetical protein